MSIRYSNGRRGQVFRPLLAPTLAALSCTASFGAQAAWVTTKSHAIPLGSSIATTALPATTPIHVYVSLQQQNQAALQATFKNLFAPGNPQFHQFLTPGQYTAQFAPSTAQVQGVVDYLTSMGFTNISVASNRMLINADATTTAVQNAFNTKLAQFQLNGKTVHAAVADIQVPDSLGSLVLSVTGLQNFYQKTTNVQHSMALASTSTSKLAGPVKLPASSKKAKTDAAGAMTLISAYTPAAFRTAYDAGSTSEGSNTVIAISTEGDDLSTVISDLRQAERDNNLPFVPVTVVQSVPLPDPVDTSGDDEWDLDSQSSTGIAGNVKQLIFYNTSDLGDSLINAYNDFVTQNLARVGNMSYGGCEILDDVEGGNEADDMAFMEAVMQGQTWFASAGDAGAACGVLINLGIPDAGVPAQVEYPGSSPYVVAVGGTSLFTDAEYNYSSEITWTGTGGGTSLFETAPSWQSGIIPLASAGLRGVPDIAMDAGFNVGPVLFYSAADTVVGGEHESVIGTSLASPLSMGVWSRYVTNRCDSLGFASPVIYALDTAGGLLSTANGFNDVTVGTNGGFVATPGWDYTTGFGSFDISLVDAALPAVPASCTANLPPIAVLTASTNNGAAALPVTFNGSQSSDPDGDGISYYIVDYGDGSAVDFETTPTFAPHTYQYPGTYTASLTVRDGRGAASTPVTQTITVTGTPLACFSPGVTAITSPAGEAEGVEGQQVFANSLDLLSVSIGEPADMSGTLVFTIKVPDLSTLPPLARWVVYFNIPEDANYHYVAMTVTATANTVAYTYGTHADLANIEGDFTVDGTLDAASTYTTDGTITLVLDKSAMGIVTGDALTNVVSSTRISIPDDSTGTVPLGEGLTVDTGGDSEPYNVVGNDTCATDLGTTTGGTSGSASTGGTSGGTSGGSSTGSTAGGTTGGTTGGGTSTGGTSTGGSTGSSAGGTSTGGTSTGSGTSSGGSSTGGTSTGGGGSSSTGGTSGGSGSSSSGGTSAGTATGSGSTGGTTTGASGTPSNGTSGSFGLGLIPLLGLAMARRKNRPRK